MTELLNWVAQNPYGQAVGFLCTLAVPFSAVALMGARRKRK